MSSHPLPKIGSGSWTQRYGTYVSWQETNVTHVICPAAGLQKAKGVSYQTISEKNPFQKRIHKLLGKNPFDAYLKALDVLLGNEKAIIQIIDNTGLVTAVHRYLTNSGKRERVHLQYSYHGFPVSKKNTPEFYGQADETLFLTAASRNLHQTTVGEHLKETVIAGNAIDLKKFHLLAPSDRAALRQNMNISENTTVFLFCSRDVPKKGLDLILEAWQQLSGEDKLHKALYVIGSERNSVLHAIAGVVNIGKLPSAALPAYYQIADIFLFPTQCEEGYGLALAEALACGCYVASSAVGGTPDVVVGFPQTHMIASYTDIQAWQDILEHPELLLKKEQITVKQNEQSNILAQQQWMQQMNVIFENSMQTLTCAG